MEYGSLRAAVHLVNQEGRLTQNQIDCLNRQPEDLYHSIMTNFYERDLSSEEQRLSDSFFSGVYGKKLKLFVDEAARTGLPFTIAPALSQLTEDEQKEALAFLESSAGNKILVQALFRKGSVRQEVVSRSRAVMQGCMNAR